MLGILCILDRLAIEKEQDFNMWWTADRYIDLADAKQRIADVVGADADNISFVENTTRGTALYL